MAAAVKIESWNSIEELVRMTLGTDKGTWYADPDFGSELWLLKKTGKVDGQTVGTLERMVRESLRWLVADGLAGSVDCAAQRNGRNRIDYTVTVTQPGHSPAIIKEVWDVV